MPHSLITPEGRKYLLYYGGFSFTWWLIQILLLSLVSFIHFLLDHSLPTIDAWVVDNSWWILFWSKLLSFFFILRFLFGASVTTFLKSIRTKVFVLDESFSRVLTVSLFLLFVCIIWMRPSFNPFNTFSQSVFLGQIPGQILFWGSDLILIGMLQTEFPLVSSERLKVLPSLLLMSILVNSFVFVTDKTTLFSTSLIFFFMFYLLFFHEHFLGKIIVFFCLFVFPVTVFLGLNPVWANRFRLFELKHNLAPYEFVALYFFAFASIEREKILRFIKKIIGENRWVRQI